MAGDAPRTIGLLPLTLAATATVVAAVAMDVLADEHPSHTAALGLVAVVVAALRVRLAGRYEGVFSAVSGALVAQPALHATSKIGGTVSLADHHHGGLLHVVMSDGPAITMQVIVPALVVAAVVLAAQFLELLLGALRRPFRLISRPPGRGCGRILIPVCTRPRGSMLRWCGWVIRSARRGPPAVPAPAAH